MKFFSHSSLLIFYFSFLASYCSLLILHCSLLIPHRLWSLLATMDANRTIKRMIVPSHGVRVRFPLRVMKLFANVSSSYPLVLKTVSMFFYTLRSRLINVYMHSLFNAHNPFLTIRFSLFTDHSLLTASHSSLPNPHCSILILHCFLTPHYVIPTFIFSLLSFTHPSPLMFYYSLFIPIFSLFTTSLPIPYSSPLTHYCYSLLRASYCSFRPAYFLFLTLLFFFLTSHFSLLVPLYSLLTTRSSLLTPNWSHLIPHSSLLNN